jgi:hypothetical protein
VTGVPGGLELLVAAGFDVVFEPGEGGEEGWAVWRPNDDNLAALRGCLQLMNTAFPPPPAPTAPATAAVALLPSTGPQSVPSAAEPRPRKTRVFLPNPNQVARQVPHNMSTVTPNLSRCTVPLPFPFSSEDDNTLSGTCSVFYTDMYINR